MFLFDRMQSKSNQLEIRLRSTEEELARKQTEYNNAVKDHYTTKAVRYCIVNNFGSKKVWRIGTQYMFGGENIG